MTSTPSTMTKKGFTLTVARSVLRDALAKVLPLTAQRATSLEVAKGVLVTADDGVVTLSATNFEAFVRVPLSCGVVGNGAVVIPAKRLAEIAASLPDGVSAMIAIDGKSATITAGRSRFDIPCLAAAEFPLFPSVRGEIVALEAGPFLRALADCAPFASDAPSRPVLNAVCLGVIDGRLVATSSDNAVLMRRDAGAAPASWPETLVHKVDAPVVQRVFGHLKDDATLAVASDGLRIVFEAADIRVILRTTEGPYPSPTVDAFLKQTVRHTIVCDRKALLSGLTRVAITADDQSERVKIAANGALNLSATTPDRGSSSDSVEIDSHEGDGITIAANGSKLRALLAAIDSDAVRITLDTPMKPILFRATTQSCDDVASVSLLMPLVAD